MADFDWGGLASGVLGGVGTAFLGPAGGQLGNMTGQLITGLFGPDKSKEEAAKNQANDMASIEQQAQQALGMTPNGLGLGQNTVGGQLVNTIGGTNGIAELIKQLTGGK